MTDVDSVADQRHTADRRTCPCPNCGGDVQEPRSGDTVWTCVRCARRWETSELTERGAL